VRASKLYRLVRPDGEEVLSPTPGTLGGHRRTRVYGRLDCPVALSLIARGSDVRKHRVFFADEETAIAAGYRPCGACLRAEYRRWKASRTG
jgi:methylphosphotriester-DNA--protein-cysteine methyltransferase